MIMYKESGERVQIESVRTDEGFELFCDGKFVAMCETRKDLDDEVCDLVYAMGLVPYVEEVIA